jgi:hypothetical protein
MEHLQYLDQIETKTGVNSQNVIEYLTGKDIPEEFAVLVHKMLFEYECRLKKQDARREMIRAFYVKALLVEQRG